MRRVIAPALIGKGRGMRRLRSWLHSTAALTATLCLTASTLVGCDVEPRVDDRSSAGSSDELLRSTEDAAAALAADPRLTELVALSLIVTEQILAGQEQLAPEDLDDYLHAINAPGAPDEVGPEMLFAPLGIDVAVLDEQAALVEALLVDHQLLALPSEQVAEVFELAASASEVQAMVDAWLDQLPGNPGAGEQGDAIEDPDHCWELCDLQFEAKYRTLLIAYVGTLATAVVAATVGPFGWAVGAAAVVAATAFFLREVTEAKAEQDHCYRVCDGDEPTQEECLHESDCAPDEYCYNGVLGFGSNECRPEKPEGQTCSRDAQCASGCCKYHPLSHLVWWVCRPASKC